MQKVVIGVLVTEGGILQYGGEEIFVSNHNMLAVSLVVGDKLRGPVDHVLCKLPGNIEPLRSHEHWNRLGDVHPIDPVHLVVALNELVPILWVGPVRRRAHLNEVHVERVGIELLPDFLV